MSYHRVIITAGISVFAKSNKYYSWIEKQNLFEFGRTGPKSANNSTESETLRQWQKVCQSVGFSLAQDNPKDVSAEYSLLYALKEMGRLDKNPKIILIHSNTFSGNAAQILIKRILEHQFNATVLTRDVENINTNNRIQLRKSLGGFMEIVANELSQGHSSYTCFAPVGGYKVMTSLGYLAGAYMGFPTAYLHEEDQILHEIPAVPIKILTDELHVIGHLIRLAMKDIQYNQLPEDYKKFINEQYPYLFDRVEENNDQLITLNAFGRFIAGRPENKHFITPKIKISSKISTREILGDNSTKPFVINQLREFMKKLDSPLDYVGELHHEKTFSHLKNATFALYKGASNGVFIFRTAYFFDEPNQILYLNRIWLDHQKYDQDTDNKMFFFDEVSQIDWIDWTNEFQRFLSITD